MKKLFSIVILLGALFTSCGGVSTSESKTTDSSISDASVALHEATLKGVNGACDMCKTTIEQAAMNTSNIKSAIWDANAKTLALTSAESIDLAAVSQAVAKAGYDTEFAKAEDSIYDALPSCCKYR